MESKLCSMCIIEKKTMTFTANKQSVEFVILKGV